MELVVVPGCGRAVVATRPFAAGETMHEESAYALCRVFPKRGSPVAACINCFKSIASVQKGDGTSPLWCAKCPLGHYCSPECMAAHQGAHEASGECAAVCATMSMKSQVPHEDFNTFQVVAIVLAKAQFEGLGCRLRISKASAQSLSAGQSDSYTVETVVEGDPPTISSFMTDVISPAQRSATTFSQTELLVTNRSYMDAEIRGDYEKLFAFYQLMLRKGGRHLGVGNAVDDDNVESSTVRQQAPKPAAWWLPYLPVDVSFDVYVSLCCAFQANGFGLWNSKGVAVAAGFFPCSSFFNHSCAPNIGREMCGRRAIFFAVKDIAVGEPISLSYIDFKLPREERQQKLAATYSFLCACPRCEDADSIDHRELYDVPLCQSCKSKVLRPERQVDGTTVKYRCPCCLEIFDDVS